MNESIKLKAHLENGCEWARDTKTLQDQLAKAQNEIARLHGAIRNLKESKNGHDAQHSWKRLMTMVKKSDEIACGKPRIGDD